MTYYEIMKMVEESVSDTFDSLVKAEDKQAVVIIEATTQIYIEQMHYLARVQGMTYYEIMQMVERAVSDTFYSLHVKTEDKQAVAIIEATTQIYVAQMHYLAQMQNETKASKYENIDGELT